MKKLSFSLVGFIAALSTMFVACSQNEDVMGSENMTPDGEVVYNLHLECSAPGYDEDLKTRGATSWEKGSIVYLIFNNGITGTATYDGSEWTLKASSSLGTTSAATKCAAAYVENPESKNSSTVKLGAGSILYRGDGTYTSNSTDIYVNVTLSPATWRLRFKGKSGTKITLPAASNDIRYYTAMTISTLNTTVATTDVTLTVNSNGYTNYIYGELSYKNGNNTVFLVNESEGSEYYRENISGSTLSAGKSAYLTIPTESTYASLGWETVVKTDPNLYVKPGDMVLFTDGMVTNWEIGSTAKKFHMTVFKASANVSDDDMVSALLEKTTKEVAEYVGMISGFWDDEWYSESTSYILCTIAFNASGEMGELIKTPFTTKSVNLPTVMVSNVEAITSDGEYKWRFDVSFRNNATKYYVSWWDGKDYYDTDEHFLGYWMEMARREGKLSAYYNYESANIPREGNYVSIGMIAIDAKGNIGNFSCTKAATSSYTNTRHNIVSSNEIKQDVSKCSFDEIISIKKKPSMLQSYWQKEMSGLN